MIQRWKNFKQGMTSRSAWSTLCKRMIFYLINIQHLRRSIKESFQNKDFINDEFKKNNKIIGVGETGLDFYYENSPKKTQIDSFRVHIEASIECNCPLIVH